MKKVTGCYVVKKKAPRAALSQVDLSESWSERCAQVSWQEASEEPATAQLWNRKYRTSRHYHLLLTTEWFLSIPSTFKQEFKYILQNETKLFQILLNEETVKFLLIKFHILFFFFFKLMSKDTHLHKGRMIFFFNSLLVIRCRRVFNHLFAC